MKPYVSYKVGLLQRLKDPERAIGLLNECLKEWHEGVFLSSLKDVADAHGGLAKLAKKAGLSREHLFRMLSKEGNPRFETIKKIVDAFGWEIEFKVKKPVKMKKAA